MYFIIFTESIQTPKLEIIRIVSGMRNVMVIRSVYIILSPTLGLLRFLSWTHASLSLYNLVLACDLLSCSVVKHLTWSSS